jgi:hypothetical protein
MGQGTNPTPLSSIKPCIHVLLHKATQNYLTLEIIQLHPLHYITLFLIYTFTFTKGPNHG